MNNIQNFNLHKLTTNDNQEYIYDDANTHMVHFIGKDIIYFHALFWPAVLDGAGLKKPDAIYVNGFLTVNGEKMSKSRGNFISADDFVKTLDPEYLRYYFASKLITGVDDIDLNLEDLKQKVNSDLVNKLVNIASRSANFLKKHYNNELSKEIENDDLINEFIRASKEVFNHYENLELNKAMKEIMALADKANQYVDKMEPWVLIKDEKNLDVVHKVCSTALNLFRILIIMIEPVTPNLSKKSFNFLNEEPCWDDIKIPLLEHKINSFEPLLTRIEDDQINQLMELKNV